MGCGDANIKQATLAAPSDTPDDQSEANGRKERGGDNRTINLCARRHAPRHDQERRLKERRVAIGGDAKIERATLAPGNTPGDQRAARDAKKEGGTIERSTFVPGDTPLDTTKGGSIKRAEVSKEGGQAATRRSNEPPWRPATRPAIKVRRRTRRRKGGQSNNQTLCPATRPAIRPRAGRSNEPR